MPERHEVIRCWSEGLLYPILIAWNIWRRRGRVDVVHVQHEYAQFGGPISALVFPLLLALLRTLGKPTVLTIHGVVGQRDVTPFFCRQHFVRYFRSWIRIGFSLINGLIGRLAHCVIVHERCLKKVLTEDYGVAASKIRVIPHGIEERKDKIEREAARQALGLHGRRMLLFFGYLARYKGLRILTEAFGLIANGDYVLFIAGGAPPLLRDNHTYAQSLADLKERAESISKDIVFTGFVPEPAIPVYFSAADLAVFPYPEMHACSGPFCLALSYDCPFVASRAFGQFYGIPRQLTFEYSTESLARKVAGFFKSADDRATALRWIKSSRNGRLWSDVAQQTRDLYAELCEAYS